MDADTFPTQALEADRQVRFAALLNAHLGILHKVAFVYCRDVHARPDLIQDMAAQLWRALDSFDGRSSPATWIYRVAMNVAISWRRSEGRRIRQTLPLEDVDAAGIFDAGDEHGAALRDLIDGLDEMNRGLVLLYLEGFDHGEIAGMLGTSAGNIGTRLNRIKQKLRERASQKET